MKRSSKNEESVHFTHRISYMFNLRENCWTSRVVGTNAIYLIFILAFIHAESNKSMSSDCLYRVSEESSSNFSGT